MTDHKTGIRRLRVIGSAQGGRHLPFLTQCGRSSEDVLQERAGDLLDEVRMGTAKHQGIDGEDRQDDGRRPQQERIGSRSISARSAR